MGIYIYIYMGIPCSAIMKTRRAITFTFGLIPLEKI